ncbi:MAG: OmpH family outer membrane protein [Cyanobacteria bacterium SIG32]|nr:OmpH family outer membrane protein [Cyanobacteria bacterium SIG32]
MKKRFLALSIVLGLSLNTALATEIVCVDVQKVVNESKQVQTLKKEREAKTKEMVQFVEKARKEIASTTDVKKKQALEEKYNKEFLNKKEKADKDYSEKLKNIETSISNVITQEAKAKGYDIVITKSNVLYTTKDITKDIISAVAVVEKPQPKTPAPKQTTKTKRK